MHEGQWSLTVTEVRGLLHQQFPDWAGLELEPVRSCGTDNALFRLGPDLVLRFPLLPRADQQRREEMLELQRILPIIGAQVPVSVPSLVALAEPGPEYPGYWSVYDWLAGDPVRMADGAAPDRLASDIARFVVALHRLDAGGRRWDGSTRGGPLIDRDETVRSSLDDCSDLVDAGRLLTLWEQYAAVPLTATPVWIHADLMPGNLLTRNGRLTAVIDFELLGVGDPAVDLMPAWNLLPAPARETFRDLTGADEASWLRGRGWALCQAAVALPYYRNTNRAMADLAVRTLAALLE